MTSYVQTVNERMHDVAYLRLTLIEVDTVLVLFVLFVLFGPRLFSLSLHTHLPCHCTS